MTLPLDSLEHETVEELTDMLLDLIDFTNEQKRMKVLNFNQGLLNTNQKQNIKLALKISKKVLSETYDPQVLHMLHLCMKSWSKFISSDEKSVLDKILTAEDQSPAGKNVIQIFGDFISNQTIVNVFTPNLYDNLKRLMESKRSTDRRAGNFLLNKLLDSITSSNENVENFSEQDFFSYITIIQSLELEQSLNISDKGRNRLIWIRKLYIRLFEEENLIIVRWTLEYVMEHSKISELNHANMLIEFLKATNRIELHDLDAYCLPESHMKQFMPVPEAKQFLKSFVQVSWLEVPMIRWMYHMEPKHMPLITHKLLLQFSGHVSRMQNPKLRKWACKHTFNIFESTLHKLSLIDYMVFIETLIKTTADVCHNALDMLIDKIRNCKDIADEMCHLKRGCFEMICDKFHNLTDPQYELLNKLKYVHQSQRGWWRLPALVMLNEKRLSADRPKVLEFYHTEYDIDIKIIQKCTNLKVLQQHLLERLNCKTEEEKLFVMQRSVDLFVENNLKDWNQLEELHLNPIEFLENGTLSTYLHLADLLLVHNKRLEDTNVFAKFLQLWKKYSSYSRATQKLLKYADLHLFTNEREKLVEDMILSCNHDYRILESILTSTSSVPKSLLIRELLQGENTTGYARIERALENKLGYSNTKRRDTYIEYLCWKLKDDANEIFEELLSINAAISANNSSIIENSEDHRIQIRIGRALLHTNSMSESYWSDQLWPALLAPSNLLNISYIYECLVVRQLPSDQLCFELLMEKIQTLSSFESNQQDSIISVIYIYCVINFQDLKTEDFNKVFKMLNRQMIHLSSQAQLFVQLVLHNLAIKCENNKIDLPLAAEMKILPNFSFGNKPEQYYIDARLKLPNILRAYNPADSILYITKAPFDEYNYPSWLN